MTSADAPTLPGMPPDPEPRPDPYAGLSAGRRRTLQQYELIANGYNPATRLPIVNNGKGCGDCQHLMIKDHGSGYRWFKCALQMHGGQGLDIRLMWPACTKFVEGEG